MLVNAKPNTQPITAFQLVLSRDLARGTVSNVCGSRQLSRLAAVWLSDSDPINIESHLHF